MLEKLLGLFTLESKPEPPSERLASALLLIELARADFDFGEPERNTIETLLSQHFGLDKGQAQALLQEAQVKADAAVSLYEYIRSLNTRMEPDSKRSLMEMLWRVAYADGRIDKYEEHYLRKIAGLLYITDAEFVRAKLSVEQPGSQAS